MTMVFCGAHTISQDVAGVGVTTSWVQHKLVMSWLVQVTSELLANESGVSHDRTTSYELLCHPYTGVFFIHFPFTDHIQVKSVICHTVIYAS